ncbi:MAG: sigma-70 family RNA polymerase sigma factor [Planctomycetaceae bacterium]|nr:sigma-70 family RNA polymerase sigma factor [Planctomycetaceae bacterium]
MAFDRDSTSAIESESQRLDAEDSDGVESAGVTVAETNVGGSPLPLGELSNDVAEIVERLRNGVPAALAELFMRFQDRLLRLIDVRLDRRLRPRIDPDDVLQEAYVDASQRIDDFLNRDRSNPAIWLRLIVLQRLQLTVRRHLLTGKRDARREISFRDDSGSQPGFGLAGSVTSPSMAASRSEALLRIEQLLGQLPETDREILLLRHFEQVTNEEAAEILGISGKAANNRYARAIARLKTQLELQPPDIGSIPSVEESAE